MASHAQGTPSSVWLCVVLLSAALFGCGGENAEPSAAAPAEAGAGPSASHEAAVAGDDDAGGITFDLEAGLEQAQTCEKNSDCTWVQTRCACYYLEREDVTAIHRRFADQIVPSCEQRCPTLPSPYLIQRCETGRCEVLDIRERPESACETAADCQLRVRQCCECGGDADAEAVIALNGASFADYQRLVCDDQEPTCDACLPVYPPTDGLGLIAAVSCRAGHCTAEALRVEPR